MENLIEKLKKAGLCGRSGSGFPTWQKWQTVKQAKTDKKYVICNASEGEPGAFKDRYILSKEPGEVISGIKLAMEEIGANSAYIYINPAYYPQFRDVLREIIKNLPIELFKKPEGYLSGEETVLLNNIEGKAPEPRIKPPFPTEKGLWGKPTLINNVETFYWVSKIAQNQYQNNRFYCVSGETENKGVFELKDKMPIKKILEQTKNMPEFSDDSREDFFFQAGGGACGEILLLKELNQPIKGLGAIIVYNKQKTDALSLMKKWAKFFLEENCDMCTPCREGIYRINEILQKAENVWQLKKSPHKETLEEIFAVMEKTSLCPLGRIAVAPFKTAIEKLL